MKTIVIRIKDTSNKRVIPLNEISMDEFERDDESQKEKPEKENK